jgi:hypothetical protein
MAVKHLKLIRAHEEHARVSTTLTVSLDNLWRLELDVQLAVAKVVRCLNVSCTRHDLHRAI